MRFNEKYHKDKNKVRIKPIKTFEIHTDKVNDVVFSPNDKYILSASSDKTVRLLDIHTGNQVRFFDLHKKEVTSIAFSPEGKEAVSCSSDSTIIVWNTASDCTIRKNFFEKYFGFKFNIFK